MVGGCIESSEFEDLAEIYDQIREWNTTLGLLSQRKIDDMTLAQQFDEELKVVMKNIS
eukprot:CAMPEP_0170512856 /NCGR_PEP_ID=MMETSP0208-20121228/67079_1 /TAXON_ID=197538 /ORGANISM="Strombidium inclinatum, Strain S3" /LENGTH=57 /DNA_ID=CAMNT_0010796527 /DNA_START=671 /DNA_END=844 /DNA_ORIENTATION=-